MYGSFITSMMYTHDRSRWAPLPASKNVSACLLLPLDKHPLFQALDTLPYFPHRWTKLFYQIVAYGPRQQIWIFLVPGEGP